MRRNNKEILLFMSTVGIVCIMLYINERGFFTTTNVSLANICPDGGLKRQDPKNPILQERKFQAPKNPILQIRKFYDNRLIPLKGVGDSFMPLEEINPPNIEVAPEHFLYETNRSRDYVRAEEKGRGPLKKILFWNDVFGNKSFYFGFGQEPFVKAKCRVSNCFATGDRNLFAPEELDALIWHVRSDDSSLPSKRSPHTRYVFWNLESALNMFSDLRTFKNIFNWTFTYRLDSDFPNPYHTVYRRRMVKHMPVRNYALGKKNLSAWFVSNCNSHSGRERLVKTLKKWIPIDVYGNCGPYKCARGGGRNNCYEMLERNYKFYMSFENSLCKDYVTEKVFNVLRYNVVPVVYGLANYSAQLPPKSYINAFDFPTAKSLASYLIYLDGNDTAYNEYFSWKAYHKFPSTWDMLAKPWCDLCARLHEDKSQKVYDIHKWFIKGSKCKDQRMPEISRFIKGRKAKKHRS
ncbi:alpha-(1,3)-fucosyltransferase C-like [Palaemon carinicauda]|uniref:alpha-(1,3)-fucosyltransferase C-like n=1 Tax=Palaemon carinicauda TaxID=392227 RepID=UPI0035B5BADD